MPEKYECCGELLFCGCDDKEKAVSNSVSVNGYVISMEEIETLTPVQARGFIVGNLTLKLNQLGLPAEQACEMANLILYKAGKYRKS